MKATLSVLYILFLYGLAGAVEQEPQPQPEHELHEYIVLCEDSDGVYEISYISEEPYDYIEEIDLCPKEKCDDNNCYLQR